MKLVIRAVGKMRDRHMEAIADEYLARARHHLPIEMHEVENDAALTAKLAPGTEIVALDPEGEPWTTAEFTRFIETRMVRGTRTVAFLIGGADGLSKATLARATVTWSLSKLTFPHRLARVILCEQIYRALSIVRGEPYDR